MPVRGRNGLVFGIVVALIVGGALLWLRKSSPAISERQYATELLAGFLKTAAKPKAVLVIGNPFAELPGRPAEVYNFENAGIAGLKNGFGRAIPVKVGHPILKPAVLANPSSVQIDTTSSTPLSFMVESSAFDGLIGANPGCDLAVSLIGLPVNLGAMDAWTKPGPPRFALLLPDWRIIGDSPAIQKAFASGKLVGAVVARPEGAEATDLKQKYLLITSNNVAETIQRAPQIFGF